MGIKKKCGETFLFIQLNELVLKEGFPSVMRFKNGNLPNFFHFCEKLSTTVLVSPLVSENVMGIH